MEQHGQRRIGLIQVIICCPLRMAMASLLQWAMAVHTLECLLMVQLGPNTQYHQVCLWDMEWRLAMVNSYVVVLRGVFLHPMMDKLGQNLPQMLMVLGTMSYIMTKCLLPSAVLGMIVIPNMLIL